ncbi:MAG: hypothetical protein ACYDER_03745 [Ktedonobacteraceae bacterium]
MNTPESRFRQSGFILLDILIAITGLSFICVGAVTHSTGWYTYLGAGILIVALCLMLLFSQARRGWVETGIIVFILTGVLAFFQPTISQGAFSLYPATPTPPPIATQYIATDETFVLPVNKIESDLRIFKLNDPVVIVLIVGGQTYHYNAKISSTIDGSNGSPITSSYANDKFAFIGVKLDSTTLSTVDVFLSQLACATTIYILPTQATPTSMPTSKSTTPTPTLMPTSIPTPIPCPLSTPSP